MAPWMGTATTAAAPPAWRGYVGPWGQGDAAGHGEEVLVSTWTARMDQGARTRVHKWLPSATPSTSSSTLTAMAIISSKGMEIVQDAHKVFNRIPMRTVRCPFIHAGQSGFGSLCYSVTKLYMAADEYLDKDVGFGLQLSGMA